MSLGAVIGRSAACISAPHLELANGSVTTPYYHNCLRIIASQPSNQQTGIMTKTAIGPTALNSHPSLQCCRHSCRVKHSALKCGHWQAVEACCIFLGCNLNSCLPSFLGVFLTLKEVLDMFHDPSQPPFLPAYQLFQNDLSKQMPGFPCIPISDKTQVMNLLTRELCSDDLDRVSDRLWWMSTQSSGNISALHRQLVKRRSITVTENPKLHLLWIYDRVFIKPLPRFILNHEFWKEYLCRGDTAEEERIRRAALGYLRTYHHLIQHESDLRIAQDPSLCLVPQAVSWEHFCHFKSMFSSILDADVSPRYRYGEIRLTRLNLYAPILLRRSNFQRVDHQYGQYFARFYGPILFIFGFVSVALSGLQVVVSVETGGGTPWKVLALAVSIIAILVSFGLLIGFGALLAYKIAKEWKFAVRDRRRLTESRPVVV